MDFQCPRPRFTGSSVKFPFIYCFQGRRVNYVLDVGSELWTRCYSRKLAALYYVFVESISAHNFFTRKLSPSCWH